MNRSKTGKDEAILIIHNLKVEFHTYAGDVKALDGVELTVKKGEILGLVGESGSGKSVTALAIVGLLPPNAEIVEGTVHLEGEDLLRFDATRMRKTRLKDVALVFQDPTTYLDPVIPIGSQITEIISEQPRIFTSTLVEGRVAELDSLEAAGTLNSKLRAERHHLESMRMSVDIPKRDFRRLAKAYTLSILKLVGFPEVERIFKTYPFELSGGMKQRAMIAMALVRKPKVFLADEVTTALDVTVQAQILHLLKGLKDEMGSSIILITHDLGVVAEICDRVAVMYAGNIVEIADVNELFNNPLHPYTKGLIGSVPRPDVSMSEFRSIEGTVPDLIHPPSGCRFHPRCPLAFGRCSEDKPPLIELSKDHFVECLLYGG